MLALPAPSIRQLGVRSIDGDDAFASINVLRFFGKYISENSDACWSNINEVMAYCGIQHRQ